MGMSGTGEVTQLLVAFREGDRKALDRLVPLIYEDLRRIARSHLRRVGGGRTLDTVGLVHEAYLRLVDQTRVGWEDRNHFLSVCAIAMRQIVITEARKRVAAKRGGGDRRVTLEEERLSGGGDDAWLLELNRALDRLAKRSERLARVVECRYFAGLTEQETAEALGSSLRSVQRDWMKARAWLREELGGAPGDGLP